MADGWGWWWGEGDTGYGDPIDPLVGGRDGYGRTFGSNPLGYGDPYLSTGVLSVGEIPDDGALVTITGSYRDGVPYTVLVGGVPCYSGIPGAGNVCAALGGVLTFVVRAMAVGVYDLTIAWPGGSQTVAAAIAVVPRVVRSEVLDLAALFPLQAWGARGPVDVAEVA